MKINVRGVSVNYIQYGDGIKDILLLHGWGQNIEMMKFIGDAFSDRFRITILDFPGFGESEEPPIPWTIHDYSLLIEELVNKLQIKKPVVMGHSFGGRVAIHYSSYHPIEKLILFGSPCVRLQNTLPLSTRILKKLKTLPGMNKIGEKMKKYIGSRDYKAASPVMRQTLVNVVNEDLSNFAKKIEEPTLLIWGDCDTEAPLEEARILEKLLYDGALIVLPGTHYAYIENLSRVIAIINNFIS